MNIREDMGEIGQTLARFWGCIEFLHISVFLCKIRLLGGFLIQDKTFRGVFSTIRFLNPFVNSIFFTKSNVRSKYLLASLTSCFISEELLMLSIPFSADC